MFPENLMANAKFIVAIQATAAGTTTIDGAVIDMAQDEAYDGVCTILHLGDVTATALGNLQLMGSALANGASPSIEAQTGALAAAGASDQDNKLLVLDVRNPANRYVFARMIRGTANMVIQSAIHILYKARKLPVTQGADVFSAVYDYVLSS